VYVCACVIAEFYPLKASPPHTGSKSVALCLGVVRMWRLEVHWVSRGGGSLPADVVDSEETALDVRATEPASTDTAWATVIDCTLDEQVGKQETPMCYAGTAVHRHMTSSSLFTRHFTHSS
jgi:hypothetical protein